MAGPLSVSGHVMHSSIRAFLFGLGLLIGASTALAAGAPDQAPIGAARVVVADVSAEAAQAKRRLVAEDAVRFHELIATGADSAAVIALSDGTELAMGENAAVRLDEFVYSAGADAKLSLSLNLGALRFATGRMAKPAYAIHTPSASLAVRGTVFDLAVGADGAVYVAVSAGAVVVTTARGQSVDVPAGQSLAIDAAGTAGLPRPTALAPLGPLPAKIAEMDLTLAEHIAGLDAGALPDLAVLDPSRALAHDFPGPEIKDKPGIDAAKNRPDRDKPGGDKDRPGKR